MSTTLTRGEFFDRLASWAERQYQRDLDQMAGVDDPDISLEELVVKGRIDNNDGGYDNMAQE